jgi:alkylation response protein AidB-like acyl-CoA dehydrogenase
VRAAPTLSHLTVASCAGNPFDEPGILKEIGNMPDSLKTASATEAFFGAPASDRELVAQATDLLPLIRSHAQANEDGRRVCDEVVQALEDAGFFGIAVPNHRGGKGASFRTLVDTIAEVSRVDGSTGWTVALLNLCTWIASLYSERALDEVFGANPNARACGISTMPARSERVPGGYRLTGEWAYASGSFHAQWAVLGINLGARQDGSPRLGLGLVPLSDLTIKDTWHIAGMRATGSNTLVADDIFVPDHRIQAFENMAMDIYAREWDEEPNCHATFLPVCQMVQGAPQLGLARAAIDLTLQKAPRRPWPIRCSPRRETRPRTRSCWPKRPEMLTQPSYCSRAVAPISIAPHYCASGPTTHPRPRSHGYRT